tara:strand:+ start:337 stop:1179 length:843 start_codon:yes stop_codon:yes gene_type:complete
MKKTSPVPKIDWTDNLADYKDKVVAIAKSTGSAVSSGFKMADTFSKELTGAAAVTRAIKNPSKSNVGKAVLDVALFAAPIVKQGTMVSKAVRAGENAAVNVMFNRRGAQAAAQQGVNYTKSMMLKGGIGSLEKAASQSIEGVSNISQIIGKKVTTTGPKSLAAVSAATQRMMTAAENSATASSLGKSAAKITGLAVAPIGNALKNMMGSTPSPVSKPVSKPAARKSADSYGSPKPQFRRSADANISPAPKKKVNGNRSSSYANYMDAKEYNNPKKPKSRK